jgi:hypothetical protein
MAGVQSQTPAQQLANAKVEGGRIIVEREVELETMWSVGRIAYAQKYLGYPGSFGEFVSDCTILFFKGGVEVALKSPEAD